MKKKLQILAFAAIAVVAIASCAKEFAPDVASKADGKVNINVNALIGELNSEEGTKAEALPVIRLFWQDNDTVAAYCGADYLGKLDVEPSENRLFATLSGEIDAPTGSHITLVHSNVKPTINDGALDFDIARQDSVAFPFVIYGGLDCTPASGGKETISDKIVSFDFATSLIRVAVTGAGEYYGEEEYPIDSVIISNVNTVCKLTLDESAAPSIQGTTVAGTEEGAGQIVKLVKNSTEKSDGRAIFNVCVVQQEEVIPDFENDFYGRMIDVYIKDWTYEDGFSYHSLFTNTPIKTGSSYITVCEVVSPA